MITWLRARGEARRRRMINDVEERDERNREEQRKLEQDNKDTSSMSPYHNTSCRFDTQQQQATTHIGYNIHTCIA